MKTPLRRDSKYWRAKAEEARTRAAGFHDSGAKQTMEDIAESYDLMAVQAEKRERGDGSS